MIKNLQMLTVASALALAAGSASAGMYDLSTTGSDAVTVVGGTGGTALFSTFFNKPAGTGYIDPFLRTQLSGTPGSYCDGTTTGNCEQGYNTDGIEEFDSKETGGHNWNHSILLGDIPIVTIDGVEYREFLLDINQSEGSPDKTLLSLDELQFFTTANPEITNYNDVTNLFDSGAPNDATLVWEMDAYMADRSEGLAGEDDWILLDNCKYPGNCGSGDFDLQALIPSEVFGEEDTYVVLFNRFGDNAGPTGANDGFEEWVHRLAMPGNGVPEPGILPLALVGMLAGWMVRRRPSAVRPIAV